MPSRVSLPLNPGYGLCICDPACALTCRWDLRVRATVSTSCFDLFGNALQQRSNNREDVMPGKTLANISRRHLLQTAGAVGGLALAGRAFAQAPARKIEQLSPELDKIIATSEPIQELASGFGGDLGPAEGPVWWKEGGYLLFSDIHNNRRMKYTPGQGVSVFKEPTNRANGLTRDLQGRLLAAEHDSRRVTRQEADGSITVIANSFQGRRLNRPNDVVVRSDERRVGKE